jgi:hypothetical protein
MNSYKIFYKLLVILLICASCELGKERIRKKNFISYLENEHHISIQKKQDMIFYVLDVSTDCVCTELNLKVVEEVFEEHNSNIDYYLIIVGETYSQDELDIYLTKPNLKKHLLKDVSKSIFSYETGFYKPMVAHIHHGGFLLFKVIKDFEIGDIKKYLLQLYDI